MTPPQPPVVTGGRLAPVELPEAVAVRGMAGRALVGVVTLPGDKSISHRALLLGALAEGTSRVRGLSTAGDVMSTAACLGRLGVAVRRARGRVGEDREVTEVDGGRDRWHAPGDSLDCGNSGTSMRLLVGLLAGCPWSSRLVGDGSLTRRPMDRVAEPLERMGAEVVGTGADRRPPLTVTGGALRGIDWTPPVASAQVKSAILLAGIQADGETVVREPVPTRAHTEEMLAAAGADIEVEPGPEIEVRRGQPGQAERAGNVIRVRRSSLHAGEVTVPGDPSQAAFWLVAAAAVPDSRVTVRGIYGGAARTGYLGVLRRMGVDVEISSVSEKDTRVADVTVTSPSNPRLAATEIEASEIPSLDEVPVLAVAAVAASGTTVFRGMSELRVKESDRLAAVAGLVTALGGRAEVTGDDLAVTGRPDGLPGGAEIHSQGDHRIAMAAAVGALLSERGAVVRGFASVATSYPTFLGDLSHLAGEAWHEVDG